MPLCTIFAEPNYTNMKANRISLTNELKNYSSQTGIERAAQHNAIQSWDESASIIKKEILLRLAKTTENKF